MNKVYINLHRYCRHLRALADYQTAPRVRRLSDTSWKENSKRQLRRKSRLADFQRVVHQSPWSLAPTTKRSRSDVVTYVVNRYYDSTTDQFMSIDPDVATTDEPYLFTNDDPLNAEDPLGLCFLGLCHVVNAAKDFGKAVVKVAKRALNNSLVRGVLIAGAIGLVCSTGIGCALFVGGITGAALSLANHKVNHTKGDWQSAVVVGGLQGMTSAITGGIWSELSQGEASSATMFFGRSVPGTIIFKSVTTRLFGR